MNNDRRRYIVPRRPLIVVLSAIATLAATDLVVRHHAAAILPYENNVYARKAAVLNAAPPPGVLLLGSSRVRYGLVPEEFRVALGERAFNLGVPNAKVVEWRMLARAALEKRTARLVVLGVNAGEFRSNYLPEDAARLYFDLDDFGRYVAAHGWNTAVAGAFLQGAATPLWPTYGHRFALRLALEDRIEAGRWGIISLAEDLRAAADRGVAADGNDHPWPTEQNTDAFARQVDSGVYETRAAHPPPYDPAAPAFEEFEALLRDLNRRDVSVLVVYMPNSPALETRWQSVEQAMRARIAEICGKVGARMLTLADVPRTNADYVDEAHAGEPLARRFSRRVAERIVAMGLNIEGGQQCIVDEPRGRMSAAR